MAGSRSCFQVIVRQARSPTWSNALFSLGMWINNRIATADIETRMAILRKKAEALHIELAEDVLVFLAQRVRTNVRRLEGALMRVASYLSLSGRRFPAKQ